MRFSPLGMLPFCALVAAVASAVAAAPTWRFSNPKPHGNNILEMAIDQGAVWQVGDRGQIYTSDDLDNWVPHNSGTTRSLRSIVFFRGKAFISTEEAGILSGLSADSLALTDLGSTDWLEGIAASANALVAVGDNGAIYASPDGVQWSRRGNFNTWLRSVACGNDQFVTVGEDGFLAISADGQNWIPRSSGTLSHLNKVAFINDRFWVVGENGTVLTNNFRMNFSPVNVGVTNTLFSVAGNTNEVLIAGDSVLLLGNLRTGAWTPQADANSPALAPLWPYYSALWDGRLFLAGGRTGLKVEGYRTNSTAPMVWYSEIQPTREWLWSATRATDFYAACGSSGTIVTSEDGIDWSREVVPPAADSQILLGIGGNSTALLAVGTAGTILRGPNVVTNTVSTNSLGQVVTNQTSLFGVVWEQSPSPTTNDLQAVAASPTVFLIGGAKGSLFTSGDGKTWQTRGSGVTNFLSSACFWTGGWVVTGNSGVILNSPDGASWTRQSSGVSDWIYSIRFAGGKLIAVGANGLILTSADGGGWSKRASGTTEWLNDVTYVGNTWYIAGSSGLVLTSTDASNWTITPSSTSKSLYAAVTDGAQLIMPGLEGVILRSQIVPKTTPVNFVSVGNSSVGTLFLFEGATDQKFVLESKVRWNDSWTPATTLEILSGGTLIQSYPVDGSGTKFFRTRLLLP